MEFRPCIDIHDGRVKQIVGGSILEESGGKSNPKENFVAEQDAGFFAKFYKERNIKGGHIILLNKPGTAEYEATKQQAFLALENYAGGLQVGGGINDDNAFSFIEAGASHVIVTSFVFRDGMIDYDRLNALVDVVGKERLVLDLSCRKKDDEYYIVTDRWQKFTSEKLSVDTLKKLSKYCDEYLIHAVDVEGKQSGVDIQLINILGMYLDGDDGAKVTYAGGVHTYEDIEMIKEVTASKLNITIGSALDLFGGALVFDEIVKICNS